uniref:CSON015440 protein n=1 Tax=Culicoides sonorensis TaxID=179676 RepID=A0A336K312_CULSO
MIAYVKQIFSFFILGLTHITSTIQIFYEHADRKNIKGTVQSIDCFKCVSLNGRNPLCDDPFHNNVTTSILESPCMGGRKGRDGLFPATSCIKIAGKYDDTGETLTVRGCALDSGTLTTDTEIIRMSHCGRFYYDDRYVHGCLQSCNDADACNKSYKVNFGVSSLIISLIIVILYNFS